MKGHAGMESQKSKHTIYYTAVLLRITSLHLWTFKFPTMSR